MFDADEFHREAWSDPLGAAERAKSTPRGWYHLDNKCSECTWIAQFFLRGLLAPNGVR